MSSKLTIVVTCTDRKSSAPSDEMKVRGLSAGGVQERSGEWVERLSRQPATQPLGDLYCGDQWLRSLALVRSASTAGFDSNLLVLSAGLGLQALSFKAPPYAATYAAGHADSVAGSARQCGAWFENVNAKLAGLEFGSLKGRVLLVLSHGYARALESQLQRTASAGDEVALVGGSADVRGVHRIASDGALRRELGGAMSSLNPRMADQFIRLSGGPSGWLSDEHRTRWDRWADQARVVERYDRKTLGDAEIAGWIRDRRVSEPRLSASAALRVFRDEGLACEQSRFSKLFRSEGACP